MIYIKFILIVVGLSLSNIIASDYDIGDIVNQNDQEQRFTICNGDFFNNDLKLSYLNGDVNGGHYFVSWFDIFATW